VLYIASNYIVIIFVDRKSWIYLIIIFVPKQLFLYFYF
jgi:hypothetical protein